jgi:lipid-A-disaccharide synthase
VNDAVKCPRVNDTVKDSRGKDPTALRVMVSCGEPSGDLYAGDLTAALRTQSPDVDVFGLGGARFRDGGGRLIGDFAGLSVTGLTEALRVVPR